MTVFPKLAFTYETLLRISQKMGFWGGLTVDWLCLCYANVQEALKDFDVMWPFSKFIRQTISCFISSHLSLSEYFEAWGIYIWRAFQWRPGQWRSLKVLRSLWGKLGMQERDRIQRLANCLVASPERNVCVMLDGPAWVEVITDECAHRSTARLFCVT